MTAVARTTSVRIARPGPATGRCYEGTETMQTLIVGRDISGIGAFA